MKADMMDSRDEQLLLFAELRVFFFFLLVEVDQVSAQFLFIFVQNETNLCRFVRIGHENFEYVKSPAHK